MEYMDLPRVQGIKDDRYQWRWTTKNALYQIISLPTQYPPPPPNSR